MIKSVYFPCMCVEREIVDVCISMVYHCTNRVHKEKGVDQREGGGDKGKDKEAQRQCSIAICYLSCRGMCVYGGRIETAGQVHTCLCCVLLIISELLTVYTTLLQYTATSSGHHLLSISRSSSIFMLLIQSTCTNFCSQKKI